MIQAHLSILRNTVFIVLISSLFACSSIPNDITTNMTPAQILKAQDEMSAGKTEKAIELYDKLEGRAAGTPLAQQAQLDKAFALYKNNSQVEALTTIERFIKIHPASPVLDYAMYMRGIFHLNEDLGFLSQFMSKDISGLDQKSAKESFQKFKELTIRFPESKYTVDAKLRMNYILNYLASNETSIARFYFDKKAFIAAINRAQDVIKDFPGTDASELALYIIYLSYKKLEFHDDANDAKRVLLKNYPGTILLSAGLPPKEKSIFKK